MIDTKIQDQVNTITNPADTNPQPLIVDPMVQQLREQEISHNLKAQGDLIENQKKTIQNYETQLAEANNKLAQVNQAQANIQPAFAPQVSPQTQTMNYDPAIDEKVQKIEQYMNAQEQARKQQAFQPVQNLLESFNIIGDDQKLWLEDVKQKQGIDFENNPNVDIAAYLLQAARQQPQMPLAGRVSAPSTQQEQIAAMEEKNRQIAEYVASHKANLK